MHHSCNTASEFEVRTSAVFPLSDCAGSESFRRLNGLVSVMVLMQRGLLAKGRGHERGSFQALLVSSASQLKAMCLGVDDFSW